MSMFPSWVIRYPEFFIKGNKMVTKNCELKAVIVAKLTPLNRSIHFFIW